MKRLLLLAALAGCVDIIGPEQAEYDEVCAVYVEAEAFAADPAGEIKRRRTSEQDRCRPIYVVVVVF